MNETTKKLLIGAAIAGVMGMGAAPALAKGKAKKGEVKCEGGNACKGKSACKTANNECAGKNGCKGQGVAMAKNDAACEKMKTANAKPADAAKPGEEAPKAN